MVEVVVVVLGLSNLNLSTFNFIFQEFITASSLFLSSGVSAANFLQYFNFREIRQVKSQQKQCGFPIKAKVGGKLAPQMSNLSGKVSKEKVNDNFPQKLLGCLV
ncbi:uncharacterized protein LOC110695846 isoform X2 [Chenopodium quinoa]|uniref:uncharacterized protein LOC110695846 isoform X2 n=1 Tax=Chenopodium quinoa TaxID=63459 RepID=UPI000B7794D1|nr:uncharacterized protein LOC110695846 isoform X2 [Chenopodium quinoa]